MANTTKQALAAALADLLNTTTLDNITVKDIVARADVSRQTFYYHFGDVYQLLEWTFQMQLKQLGEIPCKDWRDRLLTAVEYLRANRTLAMNVYHSLGAEYLGVGLERAIRPLVAEAAKNAEFHLPISDESMEFAISFFTYGVMGTIIHWLNAGMPEELDDIINDIHRLLHSDGEKLDIAMDRGGIGCVEKEMGTK